MIHTLKPFEMCNEISEIIIVTLSGYIEKVWELVNRYQLSKVKKVVIGGNTRQESSKIGIDCCGEDTNYVLIHDAVRPFISVEILKNVIKAVKKYKAVDTVIPSADTIVEVDHEGFIKQIPNRASLRRGQTPQAFDYELIQKAHIKALEDGITNSTDDCFLVLRLGHSVFTVKGSEENIKITFPIDLHIADKLFQLKTASFKNTLAHKKLKNKIFLIIGGTSGIGLSIKNELERYSAKVYALSRKTNPSIDVRNFDSVEKAIRYIWNIKQRIDCIINSAGQLIRKNVEFMELEEWDDIFDTNIKGCFYVAKASIPFLKKQGGGKLFFIGSSSYTRGRGGFAAYSSSKAALVNFCQALAEELFDYNIKVNVISPSRVNTPLRYKNFGKEDPKTLLSPDYVAKQSIKAILTDTTGSVFDIF